jgi:hypothetical protein
VPGREAGNSGSGHLTTIDTLRVIDLPVNGL